MPNWTLASALPGIAAVPAGSGYRFFASLTTQPVTVSTPPSPSAGWTATPSACGVPPQLERLSSGAADGAPIVDLEPVPDVQSGMTLALRPVPEAATMIAEYRDWLRQCTTYHSRGPSPIDDDTFTYTINSDVSAGADAAADQLERRAITGANSRATSC